jgi:hypothetical protein
MSDYYGYYLPQNDSSHVFFLPLPSGLYSPRALLMDSRYVRSALGMSPSLYVLLQ